MSMTSQNNHVLDADHRDAYRELRREVTQQKKKLHSLLRMFTQTEENRYRILVHKAVWQGGNLLRTIYIS